jgi:hypothetical protein
MEISFSNISSATMVVTPKNPTEADGIRDYDPGSESSRGGNAGTIEVVTDYAMWDIELTTANGGRLLMPPNGWVSGPTLKFDGNNSGGTEVELIVTISIGGTASTRPPLAKTRIPDVDLQSSGVTAPTHAPVRFSAVMGTVASVPTGLNPLTQFSRSNFDGSGTGVVDLGFGPTSQSGVILYIDVGLGEDTAAPATTIMGNAEGTYTETLTFTMVAAF